jgi:uncharacterized protein YndB with AHSA1/START domain
MPAASDDALTTARAYHDAWSGHEFERAKALLAENLHVEVPINEYPTKESFAAALAGFGAKVEHVNLLAAMGRENEAMLLYDTDIKNLGTIRIAEHFTVHAGQISRLRQIHDTTLIRQAGLGPVVRTKDPDPYAGSIAIAATGNQVFAALTTLDGLSKWWTPSVTGTPQPGGELRFAFDGADELIRMRVEATTPTRALTWTCLEHTGDPHWTDSRLAFELAETATGCTLSLTHTGVAASRVQRGWEHFLTSIKDYLETGKGQPYAG